MALSLQDIGRLSRLARLALAPGEAEQLQAQLNDFFAVVDTMRAVDTTGVEPLAHPVAAIGEVALRLADDAVAPYPSREESQRSAPAVEQGLYLVPRVIE